MRRFARDFRRQFTEWARVVEHINAPAMCRDHQIEHARVNLQVIHPDWRQIANPHPVPTLIEGCEQAEMRAGIKQFRIYRIFTNCFHRIVRRKVAGNIRPRFSAIGSARDHRPIVPYPIGTCGNAGDIRILRAGFDSHDPLVAKRLW